MSPTASLIPCSLEVHSLLVDAFAVNTRHLGGNLHGSGVNDAGVLTFSCSMAVSWFTPMRHCNNLFPFSRQDLTLSYYTSLYCCSGGAINRVVYCDLIQVVDSFPTLGS